MRINLKVFRLRQRLTQEEMCEKIGCSRATYAAIESGQRNGRPAFWESLQKAFLLPSDQMWDLWRND